MGGPGRPRHRRQRRAGGARRAAATGRLRGLDRRRPAGPAQPFADLVRCRRANTTVRSEKILILNGPGVKYRPSWLVRAPRSCVRPGFARFLTVRTLAVWLGRLPG